MVADAGGQVSAAIGDEAQHQVLPPSYKTPTRYVMTIIENIATKVYLDTGSDISLISEAFRMSVPSLRTRTMQRSLLYPRAVTGDYLDNLGTLPITIRLGTETFTHTVQVFRNITQPVILGWDFLLTHHAVVDLREGSLKVGNRTSVPLLCATETAPLSCSAVTLGPVLIPALSQMTVLAKVQPAVGVPDLEADYIGVLEPDPPSYPGLLVARTLAPVQAGLTYVRVMNPTTAVLQLPCDTRLGDFHPLGRDTDDDYCLVEPSVATVTSTVESSTHQSLW
ncbi:Glyceraldehyde-3-phosphate dehydrogenase [Clarias magur]|uniref:Glyceraldehyde-3-phosphate dehydrogenase n=1 Tax=Clarias magur TaxID=1594786 RepID=A0A8J4UMM2_CLAMG|nr:Glyceraldehyde-3-phosphate dehydrogenase [Clarias magur]